MGLIGFCPRSAGFYMNRFDTEERDFSPEEICLAVQCLRDFSDFFNAVLTGTDCDLCLVDPEGCAATIRGLLTPPRNNPNQPLTPVEEALEDQGCADPSNVLQQTVRQYLANLLNVCLMSDSPCAGGVMLDNRVNIPESLQDEAEALGLTGCVTVEEVLNRAEQVLPILNVRECNEDDAALIEPILGAMAQDPGQTIVSQGFC